MNNVIAMVWPDHQDYTSSKNMVGTGIWRCKNPCFFSWAPHFYKVKVLAPSTWNASTPLKPSASLGWSYGHWWYFSSLFQQSQSQKKFYSLKMLRVSKFSEWNKYNWTPSTPVHWHDQTSKGRSFLLTSCQPPLPAQRTKLIGGPH
jgi:hypothetical protein